MSGPNSGGDLFDMAKDGTTVPEDSAKPRYIPSKPRPDEIASADDPNELGASSLADAATNATDIPRTTQDTATNEILTGTGDALPSQTDSKRMHAQQPDGVTHDPNAKGSTRYTSHIKQPSDIETGASEGARVERAPGQEDMTDDQVKDQFEKKEI